MHQKACDYLERTRGLLGDKLETLRDKKVIVFGLGGVGSYAVEALARAGIKRLTLVDKDVYETSNMNRQLYATTRTLGKNKVEAAKEHLLEIDPELEVSARAECFTKDRLEDFNLEEYDFIVDAIDSVPDKLDLIEAAITKKVPIISSMGTGNRLDPSSFTVTDLSKTYNDPLSKKMRTELKKRGIKHLPVVFSDELPAVKSHPPASISFVPPVAGLLAASYVVNTIIDEN